MFIDEETRVVKTSGLTSPDKNPPTREANFWTMNTDKIVALSIFMIMLIVIIVLVVKLKKKNQ